jgi:single-stranded-DNA-specific exonuclease
VRRPDARFDTARYDFAAAEQLRGELGVSHVLAQVLVRRGLGEPAAARRFLDADVAHPLDAFGGLADAAGVILGHVGRRSRITVHGDYDVDGITSTAILVRALRTLGADVDWYLPSRIDDGYGLAAATVERLAARGTDLLVTVDCAITAVDEVAAARAAGMDVVVTDHHSPRADGALPDAPIVHPRLGGYPCPDLCAAGVAYKLAQALMAGAGEDPEHVDEDLDLVALATVADVVSLTGENRRLVRAGLRRLAGTRKPGLQALMDVARVDPSGVDESAIGFRLAPRLNAAGRLYRADAGLELLLTPDAGRARAIAAELDAINGERRDVETRIRFEAEALLAEQSAPGAPAHVLAAEGWHPGVIGIVAARIAERHYRPTVLIALEGDEGSGSGRSIPGFDLLAGLTAGSDELLRYGGHRAAAGLTIARNRIDAFREAFVRHAAATLTPDDLIATERIDAVAPGDALRLELAEELERLKPFGMGNPSVSLLVPAALLDDPRPMGEGRHVAFSLAAGGARSRCVQFGAGSSLPAEPGEPVDAAVRLEVNRYNGATEPRLILRSVQRCARAIDVIGEPDFHTGFERELDRDLSAGTGDAGDRCRASRDVRGIGVAGLIGDLVSTGDDVLVVTAHAPHRARVLEGRVGGFALTSWHALHDDPGLAERFAQVVALDPPATGVLEHLPGQGWTHLAWGEAELRFATRIHQWDYALRAPLAAVYRALREAGGVRGEACEAMLSGDGAQPRSAALAGRLVRVLAELGLVILEREGPALAVAESPERTALERSAAFRAYQQTLEDGLRFLASSTQRAAA